MSSDHLTRNTAIKITTGILICLLFTAGVSVRAIDVDVHFENLKKAFEDDGFNVVKKVEKDGKIGVMAEHKTIRTNNIKDHDKPLPKRAYYVEGNNYQMGYLLGMMAATEIQRMAYDYVDNVIPSFFDVTLPPEYKEQRDKFIEKVLYPLSQKSFEKFVPKIYRDELKGIIEGYMQVIPNVDRVELEKRLKVLNCGIDCLAAIIYTGKLPDRKLFGIPSQFLRIPMMCNAMSISGEGVISGDKKDNGHYFGRDFMFPTAGVFQETACVIIYKPKDGGCLPLFSQTAPGFLGSVAALNSKGVAIGVDMLPSAFCDPENPGLNSLLVNRDSLHKSRGMKDLKHYMINNKNRGVSWLYPTADGQSGECCVFETGSYRGDNQAFPYLKYIKNFPHSNHHPKDYLPAVKEIEKIRKEKYEALAPRNGLVVRDDSYNPDYPLYFIEKFNKLLWDNSPEWIDKRPQYDEEWFKPKGYINKAKDTENTEFCLEQNCPGAFYFAPLREANKQDETSKILVVANHCISPEMRLTSMTKWLDNICRSIGIWNDSQWRYDELSYQAREALEKARDKNNPKPIDKKIAWRLINFLSPEPGYKYPHYYNRDGTKKFVDIEIYGSISLFDLKTKTAYTRFGYYSDFIKKEGDASEDPKTITITLPNYLN